MDKSWDERKFYYVILNDFSLNRKYPQPFTTVSNTYVTLNATRFTLTALFINIRLFVSNIYK